MNSPHLGRGWGFPIAVGAGGGLPVVEGPDKVAQSIRIILDTEPGERVMRRTFGCGLRRFLMRPNDPVTRGLLAKEVERALAQQEPRISLSSVDVLAVADEPSRVDIHISYVHVRDHRPGNLIYPFYLE